MQSGVTHAITTFIDSYYWSQVAAMTPDGQFVVYAAVSENSSAPVYLWSAQSGQNIYTNSINEYPGSPVVISPSGTRIAFYDASRVLLAVDTVAQTGVSLIPMAWSSHDAMQFSADSQYLVYVARPTGFSNQIYLYNYTTGSNILVSQNYSGTGGGNGNSDSPTLSGDELFIAYRSAANNLVPGDSNGLPGIFLYGVQTGTTTLLTQDMFRGGPANNRSMTPVFSGAGETLVFESWASDLAAGDNNQHGNLFAFQPYSSAATNAAGGFSIQNLTFDPVNWQAASGAMPAPSFTWLTVPGVSYQVQFTDDLADPVWQNLTNNVSIVGGQGCAMDLAPAADQRFYRVVAVP
jgi:hypothetical protein